MHIAKRGTVLKHSRLPSVQRERTHILEAKLRHLRLVLVVARTRAQCMLEVIARMVGEQFTRRCAAGTEDPGCICDPLDQQL